jgi:lipopolysaccharide export system permease protein
MRVTTTLFLYIARVFLFWMFAVFVGLAVIVFLLDSIELIRRTQRIEVPITVLLKLSALKLPHLLMEIFPFITLFAAMLTFWRLARAHEVTVMRASGVSVWQFTMPVMVLALVIGGTRIAVLNPIAAATYARYEALEAEVMRGRTSQLAVSANGFWLRQANRGGNTVIHALRFNPERFELHDVMMWEFAAPDRFLSRIDARVARLDAGHWRLTDSWLSVPGKPPEHAEERHVATDMTPKSIHDAFAPPETISVWDLPQFITTMERAGFVATRHLLHLHRLLASPFLLLAMVLIAATVSLRPPRRGGTLIMTVSGLGAGFLLFFVSSLVSGLGQSQAIPVMLAAWAPACVTLLLGSSLLLHQEDG